LRFITGAESGKTDPKYVTDQQTLRALNRYYRRFGKVRMIAVCVVAAGVGIV